MKLEAARDSRRKLMQDLNDAIATLSLREPARPASEILREEITQVVKDAIAPVLKKAKDRSDAVLESEKLRLRDVVEKGLGDVRTLMDHVLPALKTIETNAPKPTEPSAIV